MTPSTDCAMPFHVAVRVGTIAAKLPECTCVLCTEMLTAPNPLQPEVLPLSKPGFWARFCAKQSNGATSHAAIKKPRPSIPPNASGRKQQLRPKGRAEVREIF